MMKLAVGSDDVAQLQDDEVARNEKAGSNFLPLFVAPDTGKWCH